MADISGQLRSPNPGVVQNQNYFSIYSKIMSAVLATEQVGQEKCGVTWGCFYFCHHNAKSWVVCFQCCCVCTPSHACWQGGWANILMQIRESDPYCKKRRKKQLQCRVAVKREEKLEIIQSSSWLKQLCLHYLGLWEFFYFHLEMRACDRWVITLAEVCCILYPSPEKAM